MKANVGSIDRILRMTVGIALLALIFILPGNVRWWGFLGLIPLASGLLAFCPAYALLGLTTCPLQERTKP